MKRISKKQVLAIVIALILVLSGIGISLFINKKEDKPENKTMNALMNVTVYGTTLEDTDIYKKANINSKVLYTIPSNEEFSILSSNNFTDDLGNTFTKIIYTASDGKIYTGYVDNTKIKIIDEDTDFEEEESNNSNSEQTQYTVTFDTNGGNSIEAQNIDIYGKVTKPVDPKKTGYIFLGWTLDGNNYDFNLEVNSDITLKASWKPIQYKVTFDTDGGNEIAKQIVNYGETVKQPANPTKSGNKFASWTLGGKVFSFSTKVTKDIKLKATYKYDFTNISRCNSSDNLVASTTKYSLYRCITDYGFDYAAHGKSASYNARNGQGLAITKNYVYINYPIYGAWTKNKEGNFPRMYQNFVHRIDRNTSSIATTWIRYGGHGQSFDVSEENGKELLYYNAYPYTSSRDIGGVTWYGAYYKGIAYSTFKSSDFMSPINAIAFSDNGKYLISYSGDNYNLANIKKTVKKTDIYNPDVAVDEKNNTLALVSSRKVFIYNLKKLQSNKKDSLIRTIKFDGPTPKQGVELIDNSLYIWNEAKDKNDKNVGNFKLDVYNISSSNNGKIVTPYRTAILNLHSYYKNRGKNLEHCEAEGMSIYNSKVYLLTMCRETAPGYSKGDIYQLVWN